MYMAPKEATISDVHVDVGPKQTPNLRTITREISSLEKNWDKNGKKNSISVVDSENFKNLNYVACRL